jgi:hypothetical protein
LNYFVVFYVLYGTTRCVAAGTHSRHATHAVKDGQGKAFCPEGATDFSPGFQPREEAHAAMRW